MNQWQAESVWSSWSTEKKSPGTFEKCAQNLGGVSKKAVENPAGEARSWILHRHFEASIMWPYNGTRVVVIHGCGWWKHSTVSLQKLCGKNRVKETCLPHTGGDKDIFWPFFDLKELAHCTAETRWYHGRDSQISASRTPQNRSTFTLHYLFSSLRAPLVTALIILLS